MNLKASYFSISAPLIKENFRRFWAIPVLIFLTYFFCFTLPILMSYGELDYMSNYILSTLNNQNPFSAFANGAFPALTAVIIFRYLQTSGATTVMHSMPFTRQKLFNSHIVSGLCLVLVPFLLNGLILVAISKPAMLLLKGVEINVFARSEIFTWMVETVVIICFVYAISVFAGIVTGNTLMHLAMAAMFNFIVPGIYMAITVYFMEFLFGFNQSDAFVNVCMNMSPYLKVFTTGGEFSAIYLIVNLVIALILLGISSLLYTKRKMERSGDSLVFLFMHPVICYIIAFLGMTLLGFFFAAFESNWGSAYLYLGFIVGAILFFSIGEMIVKKTPRIFNIKSLRDFLLFAVIACVFIISLNFDVTGYETRVPNLDTVSGVIMNESVGINRLDFYEIQENGGILLKDQKNIEALRRFHQSVIDNKELLFKSGFGSKSTRDYYTHTEWFGLSYQLNNEKELDRAYNNIPLKFFIESPDLKEIFESKEYKDLISFKNGDYDKIESISIYRTYDDGERKQLKQEEIAEFEKCWDQDIQAQSFEEMISTKNPYASIEVCYAKYAEQGKGKKVLEPQYMNKVIPRSYTNTIHWLKSKGYDTGLLPTAEDVAYVEIVKRENGKFKGELESEEYWDHDNVKGESIPNTMLVIHDKTQIQQILDTYNTNCVDGDNSYYGSIVYQGADQNGNKASSSLNYDLEKAPSFITTFFE